MIIILTILIVLQAISIGIILSLYKKVIILQKELDEANITIKILLKKIK